MKTLQALFEEIKASDGLEKVAGGGTFLQFFTHFFCTEPTYDNITKCCGDA